MPICLFRWEVFSSWLLVTTSDRVFIVDIRWDVERVTSVELIEASHPDDVCCSHVQGYQF